MPFPPPIGEDKKGKRLHKKSSRDRRRPSDSGGVRRESIQRKKNPAARTRHSCAATGRRREQLRLKNRINNESASERNRIPIRPRGCRAYRAAWGSTNKARSVRQ